MGRAAKWLKSLWGGNKHKEKNTINGKEQQNWFFTGISSSKRPTTPLSSASESWARSYQDVFASETYKEQNMHAIAVAAATAKAADAAIAAAQAAAAVVRLTSQGRIATFPGTSGERRAAIKIQTAFRDYMAKKAHRALKGLVKLQAHVRGYLVRREVFKTLQSMQALFQAQSTTRMNQGQSSITMNPKSPRHTCRHRTLQERFDETRSENARIESNQLSALKSSHGLDAVESPKNVEVDTFRKKSRQGRVDSVLSESFASSPSSKSFSSHTPVMSSCSVAYGWTQDWGTPHSGCWFASAHNTPRVGKPELHDMHPVPVRSTSTERINRRHSNSSYYMTNTEPFQAKSRSQRTTKQSQDTHMKRMLSIQEPAEAQARLSGLRVHRPCSSAHEAFSFKNAVVTRLNRSPEPSPRSQLDGDFIFSFQPHW